MAKLILTHEVTGLGAPGDVIDAVPVLIPGHDPLGVLQQANMIGQPQQMAEWRGRAVHIAAGSRVWVSADASSR